MSSRFSIWLQQSELTICMFKIPLYSDDRIPIKNGIKEINEKELQNEEKESTLYFNLFCNNIFFFYLKVPAFLSWTQTIIIVLVWIVLDHY
jgi:hypothetical protein